MGTTETIGYNAIEQKQIQKANEKLDEFIAKREEVRSDCASGLISEEDALLRLAPGSWGSIMFDTLRCSWSLQASRNRGGCESWASYERLALEFSRFETGERDFSSTVGDPWLYELVGESSAKEGLCDGDEYQWREASVEKRRIVLRLMLASFEFPEQYMPCPRDVAFPAPGLAIGKLGISVVQGVEQLPALKGGDELEIELEDGSRHTLEVASAFANGEIRLRGVMDGYTATNCGPVEFQLSVGGGELFAFPWSEPYEAVLCFEPRQCDKDAVRDHPRWRDYHAWCGAAWHRARVAQRERSIKWLREIRG